MIKKNIQNQTKRNSKQTKFTALVSTASPPVSDPHPPRPTPPTPRQSGSSDTAEDLGRRGQHSALSTRVFGTGIVYTEKWGPTQPCTCSKLNRNKKWKSFEFCLLRLAVIGGKSILVHLKKPQLSFRLFWFKNKKEISLINVSVFLLHIQ